MPMLTLVGPTPSTVSTAEGSPVASMTWSCDAPVSAWEIRAVDSLISGPRSGRLVDNFWGSVSYGLDVPANHTITATVTGTDLLSASDGDGDKILMLFALTPSGWVVAPFTLTLDTQGPTATVRISPRITAGTVGVVVDSLGDTAMFEGEVIDEAGEAFEITWSGHLGTVPSETTPGVAQVIVRFLDPVGNITTITEPVFITGERTFDTAVELERSFEHHHEMRTAFSTAVEQEDAFEHSFASGRSFFTSVGLG